MRKFTLDILFLVCCMFLVENILPVWAKGFTAFALGMVYVKIVIPYLAKKYD